MSVGTAPTAPENTDEAFEALLDTGAAARLLCVSPRTIQAWVGERRIPFVKLGAGRRSLTRFRPEALRAWIVAQEVHAAGRGGHDGISNGK